MPARAQEVSKMSESRSEGAKRIEWARDHMKVLGAIAERFRREKPLAGLQVGMALHVEAKTAVLALTIRDAGASVTLASCNPDSTDDLVARALNEEYGLPTHAKKGESKQEYYGNLNAVLDTRPDLVIDDGGDLVFLAHTQRKDALETILGGCEETTTGVIRLRAMAAEGALTVPVMDVNNALMKHLFDNRYGTGQSTFDGLFTATNLLVAGKTFVVGGYGWCGRGVASRAKGLGADVIVTEVDPVRALEARMDGFRVMTMEEAAPHADFIVAATGCKNVVDKRHFPRLKDGVLMANAGHFDNEIDKKALAAAAKDVAEVRKGVHRYTMPDGRQLHVLADGRLVNLASGQGHPAEIMDMSFAIQALALEHLAKKKGKRGLEPGVHAVPAHIDDDVARLKLATLGIRIDTLTEEQKGYLSSWKEGT